MNPHDFYMIGHPQTIAQSLCPAAYGSETSDTVVKQKTRKKCLKYQEALAYGKLLEIKSL